MKLEHLESESGDDDVLLLYGGAADELLALRQVVHELAAAPGRRVMLHALPFVEPVGDCRLLATSLPKDEGVALGGKPHSFKWHMAPESWRGVEEALRAFADGDGNERVPLNAGAGPRVELGRAR